MENKPTTTNNQRPLGWLVLFTSSATLICCALPIALVTLGLGAVSASFFSTLPWLVTLTKYKLFVFLISAGLLGIGGWSLFRANRVCPIDPDLARHCNQAHRFNKRIWVFSIVIWLVGFSTAYLALPIMLMIEN